MNISSVSSLAQLNKYGNEIDTTSSAEDRNATFESIYKAALNMVNETNGYANAAEEAETAYALGLTNNTHDLQVAQQKANLSLQYTAAVRNKILDAYKEIMNLQF
jgi:flagellar hook-basal body complex protein FliE